MISSKNFSETLVGLNRRIISTFSNALIVPSWGVKVKTLSPERFYKPSANISKLKLLEKVDKFSIVNTCSTSSPINTAPASKS